MADRDDDLSTSRHPHEMLAAQTVLREFAEMREFFSAELEKQEERIIDRIDEKLEPLKSASADQEDRIRDLERDDAARSGAGAAHGRYVGAAWGVVCAMVGGVIGTVTAHFVPGAH